MTGKVLIKLLIALVVIVCAAIGLYAILFLWGLARIGGW